MLKDRALQVSFVRAPARTSSVLTGQPRPVPEAVWTPDTVNIMIQEQIQTLLFTAGMVYVVKVAADTLGAIMIKKTKSR